MAEFFQTIIHGLLGGGIDSAIAVGLTVVFGIMGIINFAHGGFVVLGGFVAFVATNHGVPLWASIVLAFMIIGIVGGIIERGLFHYTLNRPFNGLVISVGILAVMQELMSQLFGANSEIVKPFTFKTVRILGANFATEEIIVGGVALAAVAVFWGILEFTKFGLYTRAAAQDREVAQMLGIRLDWIFNINFIIGAGVAAMAGALTATIQPVSAFSATTPTLVGTMVIIIGTLGSLPGVIVGGLLLGIVQDLGTTYLSAQFAGVYPFLLVLAVLAVKPAGLFGSKSLQTRAG